jgi:hypothetical protein|tara:strand:- start:1389 stop:1886 length:498 start_codon:yes stop_codon:yes gene_type:complete
MWIILRYEKKKIEYLVNELKKKFNTNLEIYNPKFKTNLKFKNKFITSELTLLGDYLFCHHKEFNNPNMINSLKFTKGLKDIVHGCRHSQNDIKEFINRCRNSENEEGYLTNKFYNLYKNSKFKFNSGLFSNFVFKIINLQKNKINILLGNLKITTEKEKFIFKSI